MGRTNYNNKSLIKILFMGSPDFGIPSLEAIKKLKGFKVISCVTRPDRPVGRDQKLTPPAIKAWAQKNKIPVFQPENIKSPESINKIKELVPDLIVVAAYGQILPKEILDIPKFGSLNIHASLLPCWRGASPVQYAILGGDEETGVTLMKMDEKMDHGPIISQKSIKLKGDETFETLYNLLTSLAANLLTETLPLWVQGKIKPQEQNHLEANYTKILTREDGRVYWSKSAEEIERQIRAFYPWPGSFTEWDNKRSQILKIKILKAHIGPDQKSQEKRPYGQVFLTEEKELAIATGENYLIIEKLQLEGKKEMTSQEFLNGYPMILGSTLI